MSFISGLFSRNIGIDLGTANTLIYARGKGIILREPTVVAIHKKSGEVMAAGTAAKQMIGRTPDDIVVIKPIRDGVIANFHTTKAMLQEFISRIYPRSSPFPLNVVISTSLDVTEIEKRAVLEATRQAGAKKVYLVENSIAGAIGMNMPIEDNVATMIVDIGGGTSEAAVIALGGIVSKNCLRIGGEQFNDAAGNYIRKKYNFLVGERTAEEVKMKIGAAYLSGGNNQIIEVRGTDLVSRLPGKLSLNTGEIAQVFGEIIANIIRIIKKTIEETPVELMTDIMGKGIVMTGGGALLSGLPELVAEETRLPVFLAEHPLDSVALGTGKMLSSMATLN